MMIDDKIIPGKSLGGIHLNAHMNAIYEMFASDYEIENMNDSLILDGGLGIAWAMS
jgi:hypothetical protein